MSDKDPTESKVGNYNLETINEDSVNEENAQGALAEGLEAGSEPFSNFRHVMTEGIEVSPDQPTPAASNLTQRKSTDNLKDDEENYHSLPTDLLDAYKASSSTFFDKLQQTDKKTLFTLGFLLVAGIISVATAISLISSISLAPVGTTSMDSLELTAHSSSKDIQKLLSRVDLTAPGVSPSLCWLFGFPQSGSAYLLHLVHVVSHRATATNYGHNVMDLKGVVHIAKHDSVRAYGTAGPALLTSGVLDPPNKRMLTWASADGACRNCHPRKYMYNYARFREMCWEGSIMSGGSQIPAKYDPDYVKSAVHLYRDPFDNILLRFWTEREEMTIQNHETWLNRYPPSHEGFQQWCSDRDAEWYDVEKAWYGEETMNLAEGVICRQEFYKYVMYHNNVYRTRHAYSLPTLVLKYEDLYTDYEGTIGKLVNFLDLPVHRQPPLKDVQIGFSKSYYTNNQREAAHRLMKSLALPKVGLILDEYKDNEKIYMQAF